MWQRIKRRERSVRAPDPRVNLGLCLEQAGRVDKAIASYETALQVWPDYLPAIKGLACLTVRTNREDDALRDRLHRIASECDSPQWRDWARRELALRE